MSTRICGIAFAAVVFAAVGANAAPQPYVDISGETWRHSIVAAGTTNVMQGHANTVLCDDGKTMFCVWPNHHGGYWGNLARSEDGGRHWTRCDGLLPSGTTNNIECPVVYNLKDPSGKSRLWCWTGFRIKEWEYTAATWVGHPKRLAAAEIGDPMPAVMSEDDGKTWKAMPPKGPEFRCVLSFNGIVRLKDGSYLGVYHRSINGKGCIDKSPLEICSSVTRDGGFTWETPRVIANDPKLDMCEPWVFRSPDGAELCCLIREHRSGRAQIMFSRDEGGTWTKPKKAPAGLSGHRHQGVVLPDGRVVVCFRDTEPGFPCHYVAWIGPYAAMHGREQDRAYRVKLLHSWAGWDCGYSGVNLLPDGTAVCTTYIKYENNNLKQSVVTTRFKVSETDAKVAAAPKYEISDFDVNVDIDAEPILDFSTTNARATDASSFPKTAGMAWWRGTVRDRNDEDLQPRLFNDTLAMGHRLLAVLTWPELAAADRKAPKTNVSPNALPGPGHADELWRLYAQALAAHPTVLAHGTGEYDTGDAAKTVSARVSEQMYARRKAMRGSCRDAWVVPPPIDGAVEWVAAVDAKRENLALLFVNSSDTDRLARIKTPKHEFHAPTLRVLECPAWAVDDAEIPGEGHVWRTFAYQDSNTGPKRPRPKSASAGLYPYSMSSVVKVPAHSAVTATIRLIRVRK